MYLFYTLLNNHYKKGTNKQSQTMATFLSISLRSHFPPFQQLFPRNRKRRVPAFCGSTSVQGPLPGWNSRRQKLEPKAIYLGQSSVNKSTWHNWKTPPSVPGPVLVTGNSWSCPVCCFCIFDNQIPRASKTKHMHPRFLFLEQDWWFYISF